MARRRSLALVARGDARLGYGGPACGTSGFTEPGDEWPSWRTKPQDPCHEMRIPSSLYSNVKKRGIQGLMAPSMLRIENNPGYKTKELELASKDS